MQVPTHNFRPLRLWPVALLCATAALLEPQPDAGIIRFWLALLACFDVVFVTLALWTFEPLMTD